MSQMKRAGYREREKEEEGAKGTGFGNG